MTRLEAAAIGAALVLALSAGGARAQAPGADLPETFRGMVAMMGGPGPSTTHRLRITVDRWTTPEERTSLLQALQKGGQKALLEAIEPIEVGWISVDDRLRYRLRTSATFTSDKGRVVRVSTDRPIQIGEQMRGFRSIDYPFGVVEFTLPPGGEAGTGALVVAARVGFDKDGNLVVESLPGNTSPQRVMGMHEDEPKSKKKAPVKE